MKSILALMFISAPIFSMQNGDSLPKEAVKSVLTRIATTNYPDICGCPVPMQYKLAGMVASYGLYKGTEYAWNRYQNRNIVIKKEDNKQ